MPSGNKDLYKLARQKRGLRDEDKERGKQAGLMLARQIESFGVTLDDLYLTMNLDAKTTMRNHILKGTVSLAELVMLADYYDVNINAILGGLREDKTPIAEPGTVEAVLEDANNFLDEDAPLTAEEEAFARQFGMMVE